MINPIFTNKYNEEAFAEFIQGIIPNLSLDKKRSEIRTGFKSIQQIAESSENNLDLVVFVANCESSLHARVEITKNTYAVLKSHARSNALVVYISDNSSEWRLSLITTKVTRTKDGIKESVSNPRRFSYVLGPSAKVATPSKMLQGTINSINDLENKFSLAVVSKEFYTQIATQYSKLVGGTRGEGRKAIVFERTLKLGDSNDAVNANFAIRLIGRLVFCWFLKQKKGHLNNPLIPSEILSVSAVKTIGDYYHSVCVPLFFEVLNKPQPSRPTFFSYSEFFDKVPFLNGGLFQDHAEDNHKFNRTTGMSERRGVVNVPDTWFSELFQIFEEYNFTIDENTSIDTELSIDPEMLGRIFENLLAEVNPETGASARKSTGSFYTPREIVDFMVEESLIAHLKSKTNISEERLRALSSYDLEDDASHPIDEQERKLLVEAIHNTTVLDPACGSGAFPIGILQRLVHMLGVLDPECLIYLDKFPPEIRRQLQKQSCHYVRKLGVIRECIHGVDIQPIAIDISRLRCFLTLVVDQQVDDNAPNRGIEPLPNLDFKFVCANTLIKPPVNDGPLFGDEFATALGELIDEYFAPIDQLHKLETARKLQQLISDKTKKELESILSLYSYAKDKKHKQVLAQQNEKSDTERMRINNLWGSYENIFQNKPVGFFDTRYFFPIVFRKGGFDIVIGNPPYVSVKKISSEDKKIFSHIFETGKGRFNLFTLFLEKGHKLINPSGFLTYILPEGLFSNPEYRHIRWYLVKNSTILSVCLFSKRVFEAAVDTAVILLKNNKEDSPVKIYKDLSETSVNLSQNELNVTPNYLFPVMVGGDNKSIITKLNNHTKKFIDFLEVQQGIIYSGRPKSEVFSNEKLSDQHRKVLDGRDILRYRINWGEKEENKYIKYSKDLHRPREERIFLAEEKIVLPRRSTKLICSIDDAQYYLLNTAYIILPKTPHINLYYILAILNSRMIDFYYQNLYFGWQITIPALNSLPISIGSNRQQEEIIGLVKQMLSLKKQNKDTDTKNLEFQIDQLVYKLYDLTPEEIEIVENSIKK
jgi:adenine-specific DNA-methyltransferase